MVSSGREVVNCGIKWGESGTHLLQRSSRMLLGSLITALMKRPFDYSSQITGRSGETAFVICNGLEGCLFVYSPGRMEQICRRTGNLATHE